MKLKTVLATIALAALGFSGALLAFPHLASAWDANALPANCHTHPLFDSSAYGQNSPGWKYQVGCDADTVYILYGVNDPASGPPTDPNYQSNLDAFVNAHYTAPPATTTVAPTTTTAPVTTTSTTPTTTAPTTTVIAPASTAPAAPTSIVPTSTTAAAPTVTDTTALQAQIDALTAQLTALSKRVDAIQKANTASWDAFIAASQSGASAVDAALAARSAGLNAIYGL